MIDTKPVVRRAFKYGRKFYKPGDVFEPEGQPNDEMILKSTLIVHLSDDDKRRKKAKHETNHPARIDKQRVSKNHAEQHSDGA